MAAFIYDYTAEGFDSYMRPLAKVIAINTRTYQMTRTLMALVDTGADITTLSYAMLDSLGIHRDDLDKEDFKSTGGVVKDGLLLCDFLAFALIEPVTIKPHFPFGPHPIPAAFAPLRRDCIIGRDMFLDLMRVTFDGPGQQVMLEF